MNKTVYIAGLIGLVFGFLFSGTLGVDFFPDETPNNNQIVDDNNEEDDMGTIDPEIENFRIAYGLTESVFIPISGDTAYDKIDNDETFILYAGFSNCPYCQAYVPVLQQAAENLGVTMIYHVKTTDSKNSAFVNDVNVRSTPTTFIYKNGVLVQTIEGYKTLSDTELLIQNHYLN